MKESVNRNVQAFTAMNANPSRALLGAISISLLGAFLALPGGVSAQPQAQQGAEELTRGPVHEAFATTVSYEPEQGLIVDRQPPEAIEELPPDQRPEGDNVAWISGYWAWDDDRGDFIWVSGIWRNLPPDRQWVPGYWTATGSRWQWISGYWAAEATDEVTYLPAPPKALENGPNVEAPSDNQVWISGNWIYNDSRYAWRPGYWEPAQENWVWVPAHYVWTPSGYVYVGGYWDYEVERRGMVFAPVHFDRVVYSQPDYYYTPSTVIVANVFLSHLFVRPGYCHYYFGDYYDRGYRDRGWFASFYYHGSRRGYDPIFVHDRWHHRGDRGWEQRRRGDFEFYRNNQNARPPHTWAEFARRPENERRGGRDNFNFAEPFNRFVSNRDENRGMKFQALDRGARDRIVAQSQEMRKFGRDRQQLEVRKDREGAASRDQAGTAPQLLRQKLQRSPVVAKRLDQLTGNDAPPPRREFRPGNRDERTPGRDTPGAPGNRPGPKNPGNPVTGRPQNPEKGPNILPDRKQEPGRPTAGGKEPQRDGDRRPQVIPPPQQKGQQGDRPKRVDPPTGMKRETEPQVVPQPSRRPDGERKNTPSVPAPERKIVPQRRAEPPQVRKIEPPQRQQIAPERRAEPQRNTPQRPQVAPSRPQAPQTRPQAPQTRPQVPQSRPQVPQSRPQAPQTRPQAPQTRPQAPQTRPQAPQVRPQGPKGGSPSPQGGGGRREGRGGRD